MNQPTVSRRNFLSLAGLAGVGAVTAACTTKAPAATPTMPGMEGTALAQGETYLEMDNHHKQGVEAFVANIGKEANYWRAPLEPIRGTCPAPSSARWLPAMANNARS